MDRVKSRKRRFGMMISAIAIAVVMSLGLCSSAYAEGDDIAAVGVSRSPISAMANMPVYLSDPDVSVQPIPEVVYNGLAHTPEPILSYRGAAMTKDVDYIVDSYTMNVNAGTGHIYIKGINNFSGSKYVSFTIKQASINDATMTVGNQEYTGFLVEPRIDASFDGVELQRYTDYRVTYKNNRYIGTAEALITGNGNFVGTRTLTFQILMAANRLAVVAKSKAIKVAYSRTAKQTIYGNQAYRISGYDGNLIYKKGAVKAKGPAAKKAAKKIKVDKSTGSITLAKGTPKGTYKLKVKITAKGDEGHKAATKTVALNIKVK